MSNSNLVHFDEVEAELERILRQMVAELAKEDPSVKVQKGAEDLETYFRDFSNSYALSFVNYLRDLGFELEPEMQGAIRQHFSDTVSEYDTVDTVVSAKVEDQTPELGVNALISEHQNPIMQLLQELDEGYSSGS